MNLALVQINLHQGLGGIHPVRDPEGAFQSERGLCEAPFVQVNKRPRVRLSGRSRNNQTTLATRPFQHVKNRAVLPVWRPCWAAETATRWQLKRLSFMNTFITCMARYMHAGLLEIRQFCHLHGQDSEPRRDVEHWSP